MALRASGTRGRDDVQVSALYGRGEQVINATSDASVVFLVVLTL